MKPPREPGEPLWVTSLLARAIHADQVRMHGGALGLRDEGLLESALHRARHRRSYAEDSDLPSLAACYGLGVAKNHPFVDGNKRTAFQVMYVFLGLNGHDLEADQAEVVAVMEAAAAGEIDEEELASWIRARVTPPENEPR